MAIRTTSALVELIIEVNPDLATSVTEFINVATILVDDLETADTLGTMTADALKNVETYLTAWLYTQRDQQYHQKKTGDASASFQGKSEMALDCNFWGQTAMLLDKTGYLSALNRQNKKGQKKTLKMAWLGKAPTDQTDYEDRD